jgi:hypothetical protein
MRRPSELWIESVCQSVVLSFQLLLRGRFKVTTNWQHLCRRHVPPNERRARALHEHVVPGEPGTERQGRSCHSHRQLLEQTRTGCPSRTSSRCRLQRGPNQLAPDILALDERPETPALSTIHPHMRPAPPQPTTGQQRSTKTPSQRIFSATAVICSRTSAGTRLSSRGPLSSGIQWNAGGQ